MLATAAVQPKSFGYKLIGGKSVLSHIGLAVNFVLGKVSTTYYLAVVATDSAPNIINSKCAAQFTLAVLGTSAAVFAHEITNPLNGLATSLGGLLA